MRIFGIWGDFANLRKKNRLNFPDLMEKIFSVMSVSSSTEVDGFTSSSRTL